ncbi:MAG: 4Fe-4S binding protein [Dysgonamonadaceae bacterium]|jgi:NADH-quinone oxidoreductase subunit I|nr:4Fe-4S binding protein [Dysgonamonadaceae bacterium]
MNYIKDILLGIWHLMQGMYISLLNLLRKKVTEQYPENRGKVFPYERMRGSLAMPHNEQNRHRCTACGICEMNCPNGTIEVISKKEPDEVTGKEKRVLDRYLYDVGSCTFCSLCTVSCPQDAIEWSNDFEHAVFTRGKLLYQLNREGSSLAKKEKTEKAETV